MLGAIGGDGRSGVVLVRPILMVPELFSALRVPYVGERWRMMPYLLLYLLWS